MSATSRLRDISPAGGSQFLREPGLMAIVVILLIALFGRTISPFDPELASPTTRLLAPSWVHLFGTDENGIDVLSRVLSSFQVDVFVALFGTGLSVLIGAPLGVVLGYFEGRAKSALMRWMTELALRLVDVIQAFPVFILAMVLVSAAGSSIFNIVIAIAFVNGPVFLRLVRSEVLALRKQPYAEAAIAIGASPWRVGFVHLLPNALPTVIAQISVTVGFSILLTAGLSFVGAGIASPTPELGAMIASGSKFMVLGQWWPSLFPGIALGLIVFWFANGGDRLARLLAPTRLERGTPGQSVAPTTAGITAMTLDAPVLQIDKISVKLKGKPLLAEISFALGRRDSIGVVGPAGAGKSVLAQAIVGLLHDQPGIAVGGRVIVDGEPFSGLKGEDFRRRRGVAIAPLFSNAKVVLNPMAPIGEFMRMAYLAHCAEPVNDIEGHLVSLLGDVGINDPARRLRAFPHELSGGMAQRVCIALALMHRPKVLIADEPTAGLDVTVQRQVLDLMDGLTRTHGMAQVIVTRDLGIAAHYCNKIVVMGEGRVIEAGETADIFARPATDFTKRFLAKSGAWPANV